MPEHLLEWWPDEAEIEPTAGALSQGWNRCESRPGHRDLSTGVCAPEGARLFSCSLLGAL